MTAMISVRRGFQQMRNAVTEKTTIAIKANDAYSDLVRDSNKSIRGRVHS